MNQGIPKNVNQYIEFLATSHRPGLGTTKRIPFQLLFSTMRFPQDAGGNKQASWLTTWGKTTPAAL
jgi:hypothetical protein